MGSYIEARLSKSHAQLVSFRASLAKQRERSVIAYSRPQYIEIFTRKRNIKSRKTDISLMFLLADIKAS